MSSKVVDISDSRLLEKLRREFPRVGQKVRSFSEVGPDDPLYPQHIDYSILSDLTVLRLTDYPQPGTKPLTLELKLRDLIPAMNQVVLYRELHRAFGVHDVLFVSMAPGETRPFPIAWSYAFRLSPSLAIALECQGSRTNGVLYRSAHETPNLTATERERLLDFIKSLSLLHERGCKVFDEGQLVKAKGVEVAYVNIFQEKYRAADILLRMATHQDVKRTLDKWDVEAVLDGRIEPESRGFLLASAGLFFFIALEALVNLTYALLAKPPFQSEELITSLVRKDFHVRLAAMHVLCDDFSNVPFPGDSDLMARLKDYQVWRNKVVHADLSDDLRLYSIAENGAILHYFPATDNRGEKKRRVPTGMSRFQANLTSDAVGAMKKLVDDARTAILSALEPPANDRLQAALALPAIPSQWVGGADSPGTQSA